jgi:hypothetical protein
MQTGIELVAAHFSRRSKITGIEALSRYGVYRLADVIYKLRKRKWRFDTQLVTHKRNPRCRFGVYFLLNRGK